MTEFVKDPEQPKFFEDEQELTTDDSERAMRLAFNALLAAASAAVLLLLGVLFVYFWKFHKGFSPLNADWGTFGDFLGGTLNPIFSLLAFLALLYTIKLQSNELRNSSLQLKKSASALETQNKHWEYQNFQSSFFTVFSNYTNSISNMFFRNGDLDYNGLQAFDKAALVICDTLTESRNNNPTFNFHEHLDVVFDNYPLKAFCRSYTSILMQALSFFETYTVNEEARDRLIKYFVRGIDSDECIVIFYFSAYHFKSLDELKKRQFLPKKYGIFNSFRMVDGVADEREWLAYFKSKS